MDANTANQLTALKIHRGAFAQSIAALEARPGHSPTVLGMEKANLKNIEAQIEKIEKAEASATPDAAPAPTPPKKK